MLKAHRSTRLLLLAWIIGLALSLAAATDSAAKLPKDLKFDPIEFRTPKVDTLEFPNGLHGYLIEDHDIPVVKIVLMYRTGFPPEDKVGLSSLSGWAIRNGGSRNYTKSEIDEALEFIGASVETYAGSYVGQIKANFLTKDTDTVLAIFADLITNPAFDPDMIELRKKTMMENIRRKADDPKSLGRREFAKLIYRNHPAGWEATEETVSNLTRADVIAAHDRYVRPNNAVIGVSGDMTKQDALDILGRLLADWEGADEAPQFPEMRYELNPSVNYVHKDVNQAYIFAGHMGMNSADNDRTLATLMNYVLGGGSFTSRITQKIRSDEGLAYSAGSSFGVSPWGYGLFIGSCQTRSDAAMRALTLLIEQIDKMKTDGPTGEEVKDAKQSHINRHVFDYESASRIVERLAWYDIVGLPLDTLEREFAAYQSATIEDVKRVASEVLHPDALTILVVGNQDLFDRPLSDFGEVNIIEVEEEVQAK